MHCCQGPEDKVGTRTNEIKLPVNKLRAKVSRRFLITRDISLEKLLGGEKEKNQTKTHLLKNRLWKKIHHLCPS